MRFTVADFGESERVPLRNNFVPNLRSIFSRGPKYRAMIYTRLGLGGRTPLCGCGVSSTIEVMVIPVLTTPRSAASRPGPIPLMMIRASCSPNFFARSVASFATNVAASGVDFLAPLKPMFPAVVHANTPPFASVTETIVLLYEDAICMVPLRT